MSEGQKRSWSDQNVPPGAFNHLLERVSNQFTPNHGSHHYQSGFMPATTPPWTSAHISQQVPVTYSQHIQPQHMTGMVINPSISSGQLGQQVNINTARSYSVSQEPFPDMGGNHTPLLRSSSDLGMRLAHYVAQRNNFAECQLEGILDPQVDSLDGSVFYTENSQLPQSHPLNVVNVSQNFQHAPTTNSEVIINQHPHYTPYMVSQNDNAQCQEPSNNFATKLSNFTASLGTWFSPLDQVRANYSLSSEEAVESMSNPNRNLASDSESVLQIPVSRIISTQSDSHHIDNALPVTVTAKPSYSDVLTKAPSQESKTNSNGVVSTHSNKNIVYHSANSNQRARGESSARSGGKSKNRNTIAGRSNSPTTNINNVNINVSGKQNLKYEQNSSKVGLDEFFLPENVSSINSNFSSFLNNLNNNSKSCNIENIDKSKKRPSLTSEDSSPIHQIKKDCKIESKKNMGVTEKVDESPLSSDAEKSPCEKLNNSLSVQQKQTPRRTTFINNNFTSTSGNTSSKSNNTESSHKVISSKEESKLQYEAVSNKNISNTGSYAVFNVGGNYRSISTSTRSSNRGSNSASGKSDRMKETQNKRGIVKRKKEASPYIHSDLLMTGWLMCLLWIDIAARAGLWLLRLVIDVIQMSWRLLIHFGLKVFASGKLQWRDIKLIIYVYWAKLPNFSRKKNENKKLGRGDKKSASGLDNNIPLPTTGEEAMKRLLACRGKDPYSILGVTHECTDDDVKKYYKRQAFLVHPDKNKQPGAEEAFKILAHAFEIIGEPEKREQYDNKVAEEAHLEGAWGELSSLLNRLKEKLEEAANTIRCTNCNKRHKRVKLPRPIYAARHCAECQIKHAAREGDIWAESWLLGLRRKYYACMEGAIYDISEWAACQRENLKHLQANTHSVQYRIVSGKKNSGGKSSTPECPTDPELEDFFNNLCREKFGQDFVPPSATQAGSQPSNSTEARKRRGKKKK